MQFPWLRHRFLARRVLDRLFLDLPDRIVRRVRGRAHWPPYSLRAFVGGARDFGAVGRWFVEELWRLGLFGSGTRILDIGCGCGRIGYALATDARLRELEIRYTGMDVDAACVAWCAETIPALNARFDFYGADCRNDSYNPAGECETGGYTFPHRDSCFEVILLTSVFTHLLEPELRRYFSEVRRMLAPGGVAYGTFFLSGDGAAARHGIRFPFARGAARVNREDFPTNAVAYGEEFVRAVAAECGLGVLDRVYYGVQDVMLFTRIPEAGLAAELVSGWHGLEAGGGRWTEREFAVRVPRQGAAGGELRFRFYLPEALLAAGPVRLRVSADGVRLVECVYGEAGEQLYVSEIRGGEGAVLLEFAVDRGYVPEGHDDRELGVQVGFALGERALQPFLLTAR